jgi:hypothetical protein
MGQKALTTEVTKDFTKVTEKSFVTFVKTSVTSVVSFTFY